MALRPDRFLSDLRRFGLVGLDSAVLIYHLDDTAPYARLTEALVAGLASGSLEAVVSTVSVTELLVKPFADGRADHVAAAEHFVRSLPNARITSPSFAAAKDAARIRARYGLRTPDALLVASARIEGARAFVTNDATLKRVKEGLAIVALDDYT